MKIIVENNSKETLKESIEVIEKCFNDMGIETCEIKRVVHNNKAEIEIDSQKIFEVIEKDIINSNNIKDGQIQYQKFRIDNE